MTDVREDIMLRLVDIAETVPGVVRVGRNVIDMSDRRLPAIIILEGDETANEDDPIRVPTSPRRVTMTPHMVIVQGTTVAEVGPDLNTLLQELHDAVVADETLAALTLNDKGIRYDGMESDLAFGRQMQGQMAAKFSITYIRKPATGTA